MHIQLRQFYSDLESKEESLNIIELAAWTHAEFLKIHPFPYAHFVPLPLIQNIL